MAGLVAAADLVPAVAGRTARAGAAYEDGPADVVRGEWGIRDVLLLDRGGDGAELGYQGL